MTKKRIMHEQGFYAEDCPKIWMWQSKPSCGEVVDGHGKKSGRSDEKSELDRAKTKKKKKQTYKMWSSTSSKRKTVTSLAESLDSLDKVTSDILPV